MMKKGKWICYRGDFDIYLAEKVNVRRFQRDQRITPSWRVDSPWHNIRFYREFELKNPSVLHFFWEGEISIYFYELDRYVYEFDGHLELPAGLYKMQVWIYNPTGLPCLRIDGDELCSDKNFRAAYDQNEMLPCSEIECGDMTPNTYCLPRRKIFPVTVNETEKGKIYDLGKIRMCFVRFKAGENKKFRCYFGEILSEALSDEFCEQVEFFELKGHAYEMPVSKAFRYMRVCTEGDFTLTFWEEYDPKPQVLSFESSDKRLQHILSVAKYTFAVCSREFHLDGVKRDRWLWGGDLYQAFRMEYYIGADFAKIRRGIVAIMGKEPVCRFMNRIMDYTLYILAAISEYYLHTGDEAFLFEVYPMMRAHMEFVLNRTNGCGFLDKRPFDWVFVDWGKIDTDGELSFEQILLWNALRSCAEVARLAGKAEDHIRYAARAEELKRSINEIFWDGDRGVYRHSRKDGHVGECVTAYANIFAVLYGFAEKEKREKIGRALLYDESIPRLNTPYMQCYRLSCLAELGQVKQVDEQIRAYWGGMLDQGATTFWETYLPGETEEDSASMYGRPFGRSHCHIWGSGALYLVPRYYYGIRYDFGPLEKFEIKPVLSLIEGHTLTCALRYGSVCVSYCDSVLEIYSDKMDGSLILGEDSYAIRKGKKFRLQIAEGDRILKKIVDYAR